MSLLHVSTLSETCGRSFPPLEEALFLPDCSKERLSTESSRPWKEADGYLCSPPFCVCHVSAKCGHRFLAGAPDFIQVFIEVKIGAEEFYQSKPQLLCQGTPRTCEPRRISCFLPSRQWNSLSRFAESCFPSCLTPIRIPSSLITHLLTVTCKADTLKTASVWAAGDWCIDDHRFSRQLLPSPGGGSDEARVRLADKIIRLIL